MKIVDNRGRRFGGVEVFPFLKPDDEVRFHGYISIWNDSGTIKVQNNLSLTGEMTPNGAEMMATAWAKVAEVARIMEKNPSADIGDLIS